MEKEVRDELRSLPNDLASLIACHLVAAERALGEEDAALAYEHAKVARRFAARIGVVREAVGLAAYRAGQYAEALSDLRAARRMTGSDEFLPIMADCERGLKRPERALDLVRSREAERLDRVGRIELAIVESGARRDLGQHDAAVITLQRLPELRDQEPRPWSARLAYAYADALAEAGHEAAATDWFERAMQFDENGETEAAERYAELTGSIIEDLEDADELDDFADDDEGEGAGDLGPGVDERVDAQTGGGQADATVGGASAGGTGAGRRAAETGHDVPDLVQEVRAPEHGDLASAVPVVAEPEPALPESASAPAGPDSVHLEPEPTVNEPDSVHVGVSSGEPAVAEPESAPSAPEQAVAGPESAPPAKEPVLPVSEPAAGRPRSAAAAGSAGAGDVIAGGPYTPVTEKSVAKNVRPEAGMVPAFIEPDFGVSAGAISGDALDDEDLDDGERPPKHGA